MGNRNRSIKSYRWYKHGLPFRCIVPMCPNVFGYFTLKIFGLSRMKDRAQQYNWINAVRMENILFDQCFPPNSVLPYTAGICTLHFDDCPVNPVQPPSHLLKVEELYAYQKTLLNHATELSESNEPNQTNSDEVSSLLEDNEDTRTSSDSDYEIVNQPIIENEDDTILINDEDVAEPVRKKFKQNESSDLEFTNKDFMEKTAEAVWVLRLIKANCRHWDNKKNERIIVPPVESLNDTNIVEILSDDEDEIKAVPSDSNQSFTATSKDLSSTISQLVIPNKIDIVSTQTDKASEFPSYLFRVPPNFIQSRSVDAPNTVPQINIPPGLSQPIVLAIPANQNEQPFLVNLPLPVSIPTVSSPKPLASIMALEEPENQQNFYNNVECDASEADDNVVKVEDFLESQDMVEPETLAEPEHVVEPYYMSETNDQEELPSRSPSMINSEMNDHLQTPLEELEALVKAGSIPETVLPDAGTCMYTAEDGSVYEISYV